MKTKECHLCHAEILQAYRVKIKAGKQWIFVCGKCCLLSQKGTFYIYGGTWKGNKKENS